MREVSPVLVLVLLARLQDLVLYYFRIHVLAGGERTR